MQMTTDLVHGPCENLDLTWIHTQVVILEKKIADKYFAMKSFSMQLLIYPQFIQIDNFTFYRVLFSFCLPEEKFNFVC